jgi:hypothetical protein
MLEYVGLCWVIFGCGGYKLVTVLTGSFNWQFDLSPTPFGSGEKPDAGLSGWVRLNISTFLKEQAGAFSPN